MGEEANNLNWTTPPGQFQGDRETLLMSPTAWRKFFSIFPRRLVVGSEMQKNTGQRNESFKVTDRSDWRQSHETSAAAAAEASGKNNNWAGVSQPTRKTVSESLQSTCGVQVGTTRWIDEGGFLFLDGTSLVRTPSVGASRFIERERISILTLGKKLPSWKSSVEH